MAISAAKQGSDINAQLRMSPEKYTTLGSLLDPTKPDNRDMLVEIYGDQGLNGMLEMMGAVKSKGTADEIQYWEKGRLHKTLSHDAVATGATGQITVSAYTDGTDNPVRLNDVLLLNDGQRVVVTNLDDAAEEIDVKRLDGANVAAIASTGHTASIIGNIYAQGTDQPTQFYDSDLTKRTNPFFITKESFEVTGSQATNIGWIDVGGGDYRWYIDGERDARKRFLNQREAMHLLSEKSSSAIALAEGSVAGSEGYFSAIEDRGIVATGTFEAATAGTALTQFDEIILLLDAEGAPSEYAMYVDTATSLNVDDMLAGGIATASTAGLPGQFGAFANSAQMAVNLGFQSFTRGGYTFHKHGWKILNDPTMLGAPGQDFSGVLCPLAKVADAKTGSKAYALELNHKEVNGYSRDVQHWMTGGGVLGVNTNTKDTAKFNYLSESNLICRAANQHVLLKSA